MSDTLTLHPIGTIHSPFSSIEGMPIQPTGAAGVRGTIDLFEQYTEGLTDLDGFSHIMLIYHFHKVTETKLTVMPFLDDTPHGVFATRAPKRPNPIGLSIVRLERIEGSTLYIEGIDVLDGTPLLDIKPYVPIFDVRQDCRTGWLEKSGDQVRRHKSDDRFE